MHLENNMPASVQIAKNKEQANLLKAGDNHGV